MRYQQDLQVSLRNRYRRLMTVDYFAAGHEVGLVIRWIKQQPALTAALDEAARAEPDLDPYAFIASIDSTQRFCWPCTSEEGRATLIWALMQRIGEGEPEASQIAVEYSRKRFDESWREFSQQVLGPLFDFLDERLGQDSSVLYVLERYVHRVEWFDRDDLYRRFEADRRNGEEVYNSDLQRFLFLEGNYTTHAKPRSASGEADLIGELDTDDPLICEGKIFDGSGRGKHYLAKGLHQVVHYAQDYNKNIAYLAVFNITGRPLKLPAGSDSPAWPPHVDLSGVRVHLIPIRALPPTATASKLGKATPIEITHDDLINPDAAP